MQAIVLKEHGSTDHFHLTESPLPSLRPGDVRIRVKAMSFNPVDCQNRRGSSGAVLTEPLILGRDLSGVVDAVHEDVKDFRPGDEVYSYVCKISSSGTYAEYVCVPQELVARKPRLLSHDQAAAVPVAGITASLALTRARVAVDRSLFVAGGAGGVGTFAIMFARALGIRRLFTTAGNPKSRAYLIEQCGLSDAQIINYRDADFLAQAIARNGGDFDCVLDLVGGDMLAACCRLVALDGDLASVTDPPASDDFEYLFQRNASFHAVGANAYSLMENRDCWRNYSRMLAAFGAQFDGGALRPPHVTCVGSFSVATVQQAHELLDRSAVQGKLVMSCDRV